MNKRKNQYGSVVKRLRHRPFTAVTRVRFSSESPQVKGEPIFQRNGFAFNVSYVGVKIVCNINHRQRVVRYPTFVNNKGITEQGNNIYRYLLNIPFINASSDDFLVVILKNPSVANVNNCDNTISKVCNVAFNNGYGGVIIANLFPYRSTNARGVSLFYSNTHYAAIMAYNLQIINNISQGRDTVFAWGTDTIRCGGNFANYYDTAVNNMVVSVSAAARNTFYVDRCRCANYNCSNNQQVLPHSNIRYPLHGLRWHHNSTLTQY